MAPEADRAGWVYLMSRDDGCHKIGRSVRPLNRAATLRCHLVWVIRTGDMVWLEAYLHRAFAECRKDGEWFDLPGWVVDELVAIESIHDESDLTEWLKDRHAANAPPPPVPRLRIQADLPEEVRRGQLIAAAEADISIGDLIERMARQQYPQHIERAREILSRQLVTPKPKKPPAK